MSSVAPPPNPCLVAIVLVVQSRAGPRFVYHYPPNPLSDSSSQRRGAYRDDDSSSSSDDDSSSSEDDDATTIGASSVRPHISDNDFGLSPQGKKARNPDEDEDDTSSPEGEENYRPPWETVLGFTTDALQKLLCPARTWHKRRFEFGINDLAFIGWPVFVREDGTWQKRKKTREGRRKKKRKKPANGAENEQEGAASGQENGDDIDEGLGVSEDENAGTDADEENEKTDVKQQKNPSLENSGGTSKGGMSMFNVVFVLNPTALEYPYRVREMYENVIKKFARALKWEQAENNYVWKQSKQIIARKEKAREDRTPLSVLDADIRRDSSLARSFADVYKYITSSEIASVSFSSDDSISIQIPPITSISVLPSATETPLPGVWLTTADSVTSPADDPSVTIENPSVGPSQLAKHFALLLLDSEASILKSLEPSDLATAMAHYVQSSTPTKSFAQISAISRIPLAEIQVLASHLVYWRRAQAIPPLHQRDTYIVSPNADLRKLSSAAAAYSSAFPALPSLPRMLSLLSGPPRNYGSVIPSKDHKEAYFAILAWLLRGGWVTQLRTFAWIRVSGDVKRAVAEQMALEDVERQKEASATTSVSSHTDSTSPSTDSPPVSRATAETNDYNALRRPSTNAASPHYTRSNFPHSHSHQPSSSQFTASLLLSPHRATPLESRWLDYLASSFPPAPTLSPDHTGTGPSPQTQTQTQHPDRSSTPTHTHSPAPGPTPHAPDDHGQPPKDTIACSPHLPLQEDLATLWPIFTKYLNGHDALEKIAVREGMKRKSVWSGLARLGVLDGPARSDHPFVAAATAGGARSGSGGGKGKGKGKGRLGTRMGTGMGMAKEVRGGGAFMVEGEDDGEDGEDGEGELEKEMVDVGRRVVGVSHW